MEYMPRIDPHYFGAKFKGVIREFLGSKTVLENGINKLS